jgi:hypothetical protein
MNTRALTACLCLTLLVFTVRADDDATTEAGTGKGLKTAATAAHTAMCGGDYEAIWKSLTVAGQAQVTKQRERMGKLLKGMDLDEPVIRTAFVVGFEQLDPSSVLGLKAPEDLLKLTDAQFLGLASGLLAVSHEITESVDDTWFVTNQYTGMCAPEAGDELMVVRWRGVVVFESVAGWSVSLEFAPAGAGWNLADFTIRYGDFAIVLGEFLLDGATYDVPLEALLPEMHAYLLEARILILSYVLGQEERPATLRAAGAKKRHLSQHGYVIRDKIYASESTAGIAADPEHERDPWVLFTFPWAGGKGEYHEFKTQADLEAEIKKQFPG